MGILRAAFFLVFLALPPGLYAKAAEPAAPLRPGGGAIVAQVVDGDTVILDRTIDGATQVRLVGLQAPKLPLGRKDFPAWPLAEESKRALEELTLGRRLSLSYGGAPKDRHGRLLAHLRDSSGTWIQGEMLRRGWARVYTFADNRALAGEMLAAERQARTDRRGIWADEFYAIRAPTNAGRYLNTFQLVEGRVLDTARVKGRVYLNFGPDWRTDFTVMLSARARRLFEKSGLDPLALKGRAVRVRGWLKKYNGPMIEATHPEQVEVLAE